jgi:adenosylhomocysteine nucleosidase
MVGLVVILSLLGLSAAGAAPRRSTHPDQSPRIGVLSALAAERAILVAGLSGPVKTYEFSGIRFTTGRLGGKRVVIALTNIGIVNAAMTTQIMLDHFRIERIVLSGVAGGVSPDAPLGAVTIPERWGFHQELYFHREGSSTPCTFFIGIQLDEQLHPGEDTACAGQFAPAQNLFAPFEFVFLRKTNVSSDAFPQFLPDGTPRAPTPPGEAFNPATDQDMKFWFDVDPAMLAIGHDVALEVSSGDLELLDCRPEDLLANGDCGGETLTPAPQVVVGQNGVTGTTFVDNADYRSWVRDKLTFDDGPGDGSTPDRVLALDMETAAAHMVAHANGAPFLAVRSISNLAGEQPDAEQFAVFLAVAAENSSRVVLRLLQLLP